MVIINAILAIFEAVPTLNVWFQTLATAWAAHELANHNSDFAKAHLALIKDHDQSLLEEAAGSINAGKSSTDQSDIVDRPIGSGSV